MDPSDSLDVARQKLTAGLQALGAGTEEAEAIAPVLSYVLGVEGRHAARHRARAAPAPDRAGRAHAGRAAPRAASRSCIVVEDLHWADAASVDLLRDVVDQLADRPLMLLLSHRPDTRPPLVARAAQSVIRLAPLSADETRERSWPACSATSVGDVLGAAPGFRRHPRRRQSVVRRGDRAQPGGQGRARARGRSLGVHGGVRGGGRPAHTPRAAPLARRPAARRRAAPAPGGGRARRGVRRGAAARQSRPTPGPSRPRSTGSSRPI